MKYTNVLGAAALAGQAFAFPALSKEALPTTHEKRQAFGVNVKFDAKSQYVSTKGQYTWKAPGPSDVASRNWPAANENKIRGPCPGLNAMANHGYIPHNGVATIPQFIQGTYDVFGMATDLAGFLAVYGAVFDGDLVQWSIGGADKRLLSGLSGLLGTPQGLTGSHNKYENDASPTRGDLYETGNNYKVNMTLFKQLYSKQGEETEENSNYDLGVLTSYRNERFQQSIQNNPYFFNGFFAGILVQPAAYTFIYRFMSNKSQEHPEGRLSQNVLKSFFGITGDKPEDFEYTPGYERIPENWYKRAIGDEYSIPFFALDVAAAAETFPEFLDIGGNLGQTDTFTGLDLQNLTGGVVDAQYLAQGNNALCFVNELLFQQGPDILLSLTTNVAKALKVLNPKLATFAQTLGCPKLNLKAGQFETAMKAYPGYSDLKADGTY